MALPQELFDTPAYKLTTFVQQCLHPSREWKEEVLEVVRTVEYSLRKKCFQRKSRLDKEVWVQKVIKDLLALQLQDLRLVQGAPCEVVSFTVQTRETGEPITVTLVPAFGALELYLHKPQPPPEVYVSLIKACNVPGNFSPSFSELQKNFIKHRPAKLKSLLRLVKHWYLEYVKALCPRANLPPLYALELLTIYAWEVGTQENENFDLDRGLVTVMSLLTKYQSLCIFWTKYYTFQNTIIEDFVRKELKNERPIILDPADPTHNVARGYKWETVSQRARQCLKQNCCYNNKHQVCSWNVKSARDIQVTVEQCGYPDLTLTVNPYKLIKEIKEEIQETLGSSAVLRLSFQEPSGERQLLRSRDYLASYGIFSNTRICLLETVPPEIQLFVKNPSGWSHSYAVDPNSLILDLKQQIEEKEELFREEQQLEFQGQVLQDWWRLGICGFQDSDTLILSKKKAGEAQFLPR
ncbi:2'-5'-oligoadenylate synthase-like protein isoform X2 [Camelus ferus]|uniref:2'-5'-oligoadenylate synthase-like protein isoform X2 n=2 Tax=Camelus TaxID=9836 RepID=A0A8B7K5M4_CAMFR|nr:2'-5'-oligoadenylate synthase-like protein isoform X2 [Camelus bactrianus]XP_014409147.1 2'-5'-oligoadenylate synthase-like protein isoform X2 [Camelus ferus]